MLAKTIVLLLCTLGTPFAAERDIAEWVIRSGGRVILQGSRTPLRDVIELPASDLHITGIDLTGTTIEPKELKMISGLTGLR